MTVRFANFFGLVTLTTVLALAVGCGGGSTAGTNQSRQSSAAIAFGDAPADSIVGFEITINSLTLTSSSGSTVVLSTPRRLELTHLSATVEPVSLTSVPDGTYTQASVTWSSPEVTFLDATGTLRQAQSSASGTTTIAVNFTISSGSVLSFDVDVATSVNLNLTAGTATFNSPVFTFMAGHSVAEAEREAETGELEHIVGSVVSASSNAVTISAGAADTGMTFTVNSTTQLEGITNTSQLVANQVIRVEGTIQADGSLLAKEIEAESADGNGLEAEGLVTGISAPSFTMIVHDASGTSIGANDLGKTITVDTTGAQFSVGKTKLNVGSFTFASIADLHKGQRVEVDSDIGKTAGAGTVSDDGTVNSVKKIKLVQQALTGTVSAPTGSSFTLTLPTDSAFAKLAGTTSVQVVFDSNAQMKATISDGATLRVRGLLFNDGTYHLVAGRITTP